MPLSTLHVPRRSQSVGTALAQSVAAPPMRADGVDEWGGGKRLAHAPLVTRRPRDGAPPAATTQPVAPGVPRILVEPFERRVVAPDAIVLVMPASFRVYRPVLRL